VAAAFGQFGDRAAGLAGTHFFTWFNLQRADGDGVYRPSGQSFRDLVSLTVDAPGGRLEALSLAVSRGFIDDPRQGAFARDIVKSFLEALDGKAFAPLIAEVFFRDNGPMLMRGSPPNLPPAASEPYLVFSGAAPQAELRSGSLNLTFANAAVASGGWFTLEARRSPAARPGILARLFGR
jgi:hypothetical protein